MVGIGIYLIAPNLAVTILPFLLLAACPISMMLMMREMQGSQSEVRERQASPREESLDVLKQAESRSAGLTGGSV
jgi:hypothetical protein